MNLSLCKLRSKHFLSSLAIMFLHNRAHNYIAPWNPCRCVTANINSLFLPLPLKSCKRSSCSGKIWLPGIQKFSLSSKLNGNVKTDLCNIRIPGQWSHYKVQWQVVCLQVTQHDAVCRACQSHLRHTHEAVQVPVPCTAQSRRV